MLFMRILYILLLIGSVLFYILYVGNSSAILMAFLFVMPVFLIIMLFCAVSKAKADIKLSSPYAQRGEKFGISVTLKNNSIFPVSQAKALVRIKNQLSGENTEFYISLPLLLKNNHTVTPWISLEGCGIYSIELISVKYFDLFFLFTLKKKINKSISLFILPTIHPINATIIPEKNISSDSDVFSPDKRGDDPSEIFDIREYQDGDKQNRIHYKLSAKSDITYVKEFSFPVLSKLGLLVEPVSMDSKGYDFDDIFSTMLDAAASFFYYACENNGCTVLLPLDEKHEQAISYESNDDFSQCMLSIMKNSVIKSIDFPSFELCSGKQLCSTLIYVTSRFDDNISSLLLKSKIALKYIVVHITPQSAQSYKENNLIYINATADNLSIALSEIERWQ